MGGGFSNVLGHVASGYEDARQKDLQRGFEQEMDTRRQAGDFLQKIAQDESAHPDVRNAAVQEWGNLQSLDHTKKYKLDPHKVGLIRPGLSQPSPPPMTQVGATGAQVPLFTPPPSISAPTPPPDIAGTFATPSEQTNILANRAGAVTGAQTSQQMATPIYQQGEHGGLNAVPISHHGTVMGPAIPNVVPPQMFTGNIQGDKIPASIARQNGIPVPDEIPEDGWVNVRRNKAGMITNVAPTVPPAAFAPQSSTGATTDPVTGLTTKSSGTKTRSVPGLSAPAPPPGTAAPKSSGAPKPVAGGGGTGIPATPIAVASGNTVGGRALPAAAMGIISSQAKNYERSGIAPSGKTVPIVQQWMEENGYTPHTPQQVSDYQKGFDLAVSEDRRLKMMSDLAAKVASDPSPENVGSYDAALLAYHMGMTVGQVKGMRTGKDMVLMHEKARSLPENLQVAAESWVNGAQLSSEQRTNFVDLAKESRKSAWSQAVTTAKGMGFSRFPNPTPGLPPMGLWPGVVNKGQLVTAAKDHHISYGEARKQAIAAGMNVQD